MIQNQARRKISFKKLHDPTAQLYKDPKLLEFCDIVHLQNCLFMNQIKQNEKLAKTFSELKYCGYNHNFQTRLVTRKLLDIVYVKTDAYEIPFNQSVNQSIHQYFFSIIILLFKSI